MADLHQTFPKQPYSTNDETTEFNYLEYVQSIYELAIQSAGIGIFYYDVDRYGAKRFAANDIYADLLGLTPDQDGLYLLQDFEEATMEVEANIANQVSIHQSIDQLMSGSVEGTQGDILKLRNKKTGEINYYVSSSRIDQRYEDGRPRRIGGSIIDITERVLREKHQMNFAFTDELTRLANNRKLIHDMPQRTDGIGLFFDLDGFKKINDTFGHLVGDDLLRIYAKAILRITSTYEGIYPYRLHGDEFFVFCEGKDASFGQQYHQQVQSLVKELIQDYGKPITLEASMGYGLYKQGMDIDDFIKEADYAMYQTKIAKKHNQKKTK